jgi:hypothetical protein
MGKPVKNKTVDFPAYCWAFDLVQKSQAISGWQKASICNELDPSDEHYSFEKLKRGAFGDGAVVAPRYEVSKGKVVKIGSVFLKEDGSLMLKRKGGGEEKVGSVSPTLAKYFIAGAFGMAELAGSYDLDGGIVAGIQNLYGVCREDFETCMQSPEALVLKASIAEIEGEAAALAKAKGDVKSLRSKYTVLTYKVKDKEKLESQVAPLSGAMKSELDSFSDCAKATQQVEAMIKMAENMIKEEAAAAALAVQLKKKEEMKSEIEWYNQTVAKLIVDIKEEEPWYTSRYTEALNAAMACMPTPLTLEQQLNVAKNKYDMAWGLRLRAENHGAKKYCSGEWETSKDCKTVTEYPGVGWMECETNRHCTDWTDLDYDYSAKGLMTFATGFCSLSPQL